MRDKFLKIIAAVCIAAVLVFGKTDITNKFTDANFKAEVYNAIGKTSPAPIYDSDVDTVKLLDVYSKDITSLCGIEYFTALTKLECSGNNITKLTFLDLSENIMLTRLNCASNNLTSLDLSKNVMLEYLNCYDNNLTSLDLSRNAMLTYLDCDNNSLTYLDLPTAMMYLHCRGNSLTALDVSNCPAIRTLDCTGNQLTTLNISNKTVLTTLMCDFNQLTSLDLSNNLILKDLDCRYNQLTILDISNCPALKKLSCDNNQLKILDVSSCPVLEYLDVKNNYLTSEDKIIGLDRLITNLFFFNPQKNTTPIRSTAAKKIITISFAGIRNGGINLNLKSGNYIAELYNLQGRLVDKAEISAIDGINATGIKTNNFSNGMFILNVKQAGASVLKQKIKI